MMAAAFCLGGVGLSDLANAPKAKEVTYKTTTDDTALKLFVIEPNGFKSDDKRPAVVFIHGGGWKQGNPEMMLPLARYFATRGAVGVSVQYRLAKERGGTTIYDCLADGKSAMRYIRTNAAKMGIDPNQIALVGESAGGHLAAAVGILNEWDDPKDDSNVSCVPNAMVLLNPVVDMTTVPWLKDIPGFVGGSSSETPEDRLKGMSPILQIRKNLPPTLLMHGTGDKIVPFEQAERFAKEMTKAGNKCEFVPLKDVDHAFSIPNVGKPATVVQTLEAMDKFLAGLKWLTGEPTIEAAK